MLTTQCNAYYLCAKILTVDRMEIMQRKAEISCKIYNIEFMVLITETLENS